MTMMPDEVTEGVRLLYAAENSGSSQLLEEAIVRLRQAYDAGGPVALMVAIPTGRAYALRWERQHRDEDAETALEILSGVVVPPEAAVMAGAMMGTLLGRRYELARRAEDLDDAIRLLTGVVTRTPPGSAQHSGRTLNLCRFLLRAFVDRESVSALGLAQAAARHALHTASSGDPSRPSLVGVAGQIELFRFDHDLVDDDLPAIELLTEAARQITEPGERRSLLDLLGGALIVRIRRLRDPDDADRAIRLLEEALRSAPSSKQDLQTRSMLGVALATRAELTQRPGDLRSAATVLSTVVDAARDGTRDRLLALINLTDVTRQLAELTDDREQLEVAIGLANEAIAAASSDGDEEALAAARCNLGLLILLRGTTDDSSDDVETALGLLRDARPAAHSNVVPILSGIGQAYLARYRWSAAPEDLGAAARHLEEALGAIPEQARRSAPRIVATLGRALVMTAIWHPNLADAGDLDRGISLLRLIVDAPGPTGTVDRSVAEALARALVFKYQATGDQALVDEANRLLDGGLHLQVTPSESPTSVVEALARGEVLLDEYRATGGGAVLDAAVAVMRSGTTLADAGTEDRTVVAELYSQLGIALRHRYLRSQNRSDADASIAAGLTAVDVTPSGHPARAGRLANLANSYRVRYENAGDDADLDAAISLASESLAATALEDPIRPSIYTSLGNALAVRFRARGRSEDLDEAIEAHRAAIAASEPGSPRLPRYVGNLGASLLSRFQATRGAADLAEAIGLLRQAFNQYRADDPERASAAANLVGALDDLWDRDRDPLDLDAMVDIGAAALDIAPAGHPARVHVLGRLAGALYERFQHHQRPDDLQRSANLVRERLSLLTDDSAERATAQADLGVMLWQRNRYGGTESDLEEAVNLLAEAIRALPAADRHRSGALSNLALALEQRYAAVGDRGDLAAAVEHLRIAAGLPEVEARDRVGALVNLTRVLLSLAVIDADPAILDEAVDSARRAEGLSAPDHLGRVQAIANLCLALRVRFERGGEPRDLDDAIEAGRRAVKLGERAGPARYGALSALGSAYQTRYEWSDQLADLDAAVAAHREALREMRAGQPDFPIAAHNVGNVLRQRYRVLRERADLEESIRLSREAVTATPVGDLTRTSSLVNLGIAMRLRWRATSDNNDLTASVEAFRQALTSLEHRPDDPTRVSVLVNLGAILCDRFAAVGVLTDLTEAVAAYRQARAIVAKDHPRRAVVLASLGDALRMLAAHPPGDERLQWEAVEAYREAAELPVAEPQVRIEAARRWGLLTHLLGDPEQAARGLALAIQLLPLVTWHGLDAETRERQLSRLQGLATDAAAAAVLAGRPEQAVELLEQGRSVLWSQALSLQSDLTDLEDVAPRLAQRLREIGDALNTPANDTSSSVRRADTDRWQLAREWDDTVGQIRQIDGFEHFFEPIPYAKLSAAAADGPVVIVNVSDLACHALVVQAGTDRVTPVLLDTLTSESAKEHVGLLRAVLGRHPDMVVPGAACDRLLFEILGWLWDCVAGPVLDNPSVRTAMTDTRRIWWCPTGSMAMLPLHAAGRFEPDGSAENTVATGAVSSYTPTLAALLRCREATNTIRCEPHQLAIAMPETPDMSALPAVRRELAVLERYFPTTGTGRHLIKEDATRDQISTELPRHSWVHWACHGEQDDNDPSRSAFYIWDGPFTMADLGAISLSGPDLAFLSACNTATGSTRLTDEALHLAAVTQILGYPHVVATLWSIDDFETPGVAEGFYRRLASTGRPRSEGAALALHESIEDLRRSIPDEPLVWASYVHFGP